MTSFERTLVTAALPYANGEIHLGHLAGAYLPADIYVRYLRLRGRGGALHLRHRRVRRAHHADRREARASRPRSWWTATTPSIQR